MFLHFSSYKIIVVIINWTISFRLNWIFFLPFFVTALKSVLKQGSLTTSLFTSTLGQYVYLNSFRNGSWEKEECVSDKSFAKGAGFYLFIVINSDNYEVSLLDSSSNKHFLCSVINAYSLSDSPLGVCEQLAALYVQAPHSSGEGFHAWHSWWSFQSHLWFYWCMYNHFLCTWLECAFFLNCFINDHVLYIPFSIFPHQNWSSSYLCLDQSRITGMGDAFSSLLASPSDLSHLVIQPVSLQQIQSNNDNVWKIEWN